MEEEIAEIGREGEPGMVNLQVTVRPAEPGDFVRIADLVNRAFEVERQYVMEPAETADKIRDDMDVGLYLVAIDSDRQLVGCVYISTREKKIIKLAVEPSIRRRSVGRQLMKAAETYGRNNGCDYLEIAIWSFRPELLPYYRNQGYTEKTGVKGLPGSSVRCLKPDCFFHVMFKHLI